jgi:hypothetical protein
LAGRLGIDVSDDRDAHDYLRLIWFRRATTFARLWTILEALVNEVTRSVFVLIDRIEDCNDADDGAADVSHHLLAYLKDEEHVSVIVTSMYEPPDGLVGDDNLRHFY